MEKEFWFGKLDTNDPNEIEAMEKALDEKYQRVMEEREKEKNASEKKAV